MKVLSSLLFCLILICNVSANADDMLAGHQQLLVVTTRNWEDTQGQLQRYERQTDQATWMRVGQPIPVVIGESGLAWGIGLHPASQTLTTKVEGDGKSPAGIFSLGSVFGFAPEITNLKMEYLYLDEFTEAVDDPHSYYYNCIVNRKNMTPDWRSSEKMTQEPLYQIGVVINHNYPHPKPAAGSAIFFHIWRSENGATAGCTAIAKAHLETVIRWLDKQKNPLLVQLPYLIYNEKQAVWSLPKMDNNKELARTSNLVNLADINPRIILDIRYATSNNFLGFPVYTKHVCYLHKDAANALNRVQQELSSMHLGLKVFDGYRPLSIQQIMWDTIQDERYVSNPAVNKGRHTRGTAVDVTLVNESGNELEMPTGFDDFTEKAHSDYPNVSEAARKNRTLLRDLMTKHGFQGISTEWWHFDLIGWRDDAKFPPLDIPIE